jgi:hypothetical protein
MRMMTQNRLFVEYDADNRSLMVRYWVAEGSTQASWLGDSSKDDQVLLSSSMLGGAPTMVAAATTAIASASSVTASSTTAAQQGNKLTSTTLANGDAGDAKSSLLRDDSYSFTYTPKQSTTTPRTQQLLFLPKTCRITTRDSKLMLRHSPSIVDAQSLSSSTTTMADATIGALRLLDFGGALRHVVDARSVALLVITDIKRVVVHALTIGLFVSFVALLPANVSRCNAQRDFDDIVSSRCCCQRSNIERITRHVVPFVSRITSLKPVFVNVAARLVMSIDRRAFCSLTIDRQSGTKIMLLV